MLSLLKGITNIVIEDVRKSKIDLLGDIYYADTLHEIVSGRVPASRVLLLRLLVENLYIGNQKTNGEDVDVYEHISMGVYDYLYKIAFKEYVRLWQESEVCSVL